MSFFDSVLNSLARGECRPYGQCKHDIGEKVSYLANEKVENRFDHFADNDNVHVLSPLSAHDNNWGKTLANVKITR